MSGGPTAPVGPDWAAWAVWADALADAGDARGAAVASVLATVGDGGLRLACCEWYARVDRAHARPSREVIDATAVRQRMEAGDLSGSEAYHWEAWVAREHNIQLMRRFGGGAAVAALRDAIARLGVVDLREEDGVWRDAAQCHGHWEAVAECAPRAADVLGLRACLQTIGRRDDL